MITRLKILISISLQGAAYEEGRIQQKEINPNDCAMKIKNVIQADDGNWNCNVTSKLSNDEYDIESILDIQGSLKRKRYIKSDLKFLVKWKGYDDNQNTWEPEKNLSSC